MKYKIGDKFLNELEISEINQEKAAPYFLSGGQGVGWWSEAALMDLRKYITGGWIPVSERLPECEWGAETSGLLYQYKETGTIEVGYYGRGRKIRDSYFRHYRNASDGIDSSNVIAWMPLPEPYRPEN